MLKKIVTIILSLLMLVSAMSVSADVVTESSGKVIYTDDFEHVSVGSSGEKNFNGYTNGSDMYESDVISPAASKKEGRGGVYTGIGVDGSQAFKSRDMSPAADTNKRRLYTRALEIGSGGTKWYEFTVDFQTSAVCNGLYLFSNLFYFNNAGTIRVYEEMGASSLSDGGTYAANTWYKGVVIVHGTTLEGWIYDQSGNLVAESIKTYSDSGYESRKLCIYAVSSSYATDPYVTLDNLKIVEYDPSVVAPTCDEASIVPDEADVARNASLTFTFDQPLTIDAMSSAANLSKVEDDGSLTPVTGATVELSDVDSHKAEITYTGLLERNTEYVVSFANLENVEGLSCTETYRFTTEDLHLYDPVSIEEIGAPDSGTGLTPVTFTISDTYEYPTFTGAVMIMVYEDNKMVDFDYQTLTGVSAGDCTVDFDLVTIPAGAEVRIVLVDYVNELIPLATGVTVN